MKHFFLGAFALCLALGSTAQQKEGKITYQRKVTFQVQLNNPNVGDIPPQTRINQFELNFANGQMVWQQLEDNVQDEIASSSGGGLTVIRNMSTGAEDITFCDFNDGRKLQQRDFLDKRFLVSDSIRKGNWKLTEETKTILDHVCRKAVSQRIGKRSVINMQDGKMERKEVDDTSSIEAWFTSDIPVAVGPEVQGQLPGAILEITLDNGRTVYQAIDISPKVNLKVLKEPTKGKKVTQQEFTVERNKLLEEMQKNNGGMMKFRG